MSTYDDANLIILNDGAYLGGVKALKPADANLVPTGVGDLTHDRNSTATFVNSQGLIETAAIDIPRFDYSNGSCPSLLVEPQRTNLITYSEDFTDASYVKTDCNITANQGAAPDGTNTADLMTLTAANGRIDVTGFAPGTLRTQSIYVKSYNGQSVTVQMDFAGLDPITFETTDEWARISTLGTNILLSNRFRLRIVGDSGANVLIWGAQLEESYLTSYIPSSGLTETRLADILDNSGDSSTFNSTEGVLFLESSALFNDLTNRIITLSDGTSNNRVSLFYSSNSEQIGCNVFVGGALQTSHLETLADTTQEVKMAIKYKENDFAFWVNGVEVYTDVSGSVPSVNVLNELRLDNGAGASSFYGRIKQILVFNTVLSDSELQSLTT